MHEMLWNVFRQIRDGAKPGDGVRWRGLLEGFDCVGRKVHPSNILRTWFNSAMWLWDGQGDGLVPMEAYQLVWPGAGNGLFPWDAGCNDIVRETQPPLYLPNRALQ
jgi:hypothetical protein